MVGSSFINRELSWLDFARRVLELAEDPDTPLLERVKFAGIMGMIYDEFTMKRLGGLRQQMQRPGTHLSADGLTPREEFEHCRTELNRQYCLLSHLVHDELRPALAAAGLPLFDYTDLDERQHSHLTAWFHESIEPILTPLSVDVGHPFPFLSSGSLNIAVTVHQPREDRQRFVRLKVPPNRDRWCAVPGGGVVPLEQVIEHNIHSLLPDGAQYESCAFRVLRGAKDSPWERLADDVDPAGLDPGSLIDMVEAELTERRFAGVVRLEADDSMSEPLRGWLAGQLHMDVEDTATVGPLLGLTDLGHLVGDGHPELRDPPHVPVSHPRLAGLAVHDYDGFFREIRSRDLLLHHPYQRFDNSVLRLIESAAFDPQVLAIKLTIYRTSRDSPIVRALTKAARRRKQVAVLVEITARFDEAPNIVWGEQLERAGAHVIYGMERLKTHVKLCLVVREEEDGLRRYVHYSTGNYHTGTAQLYEDLGVLSCEPALGRKVAAVFNELTAAVPAPDYGDLLVSPHNLRQRFTDMIRREAEHARARRPCGIRAKMNQLQDRQIIAELYDASQAGVPIDLNVRGLCCLRAGVAQLSETIRVNSTLGRFLEHGRIYRFENGGDAQFFIGSADWMRRNLDNRMETVVPVSSPNVCSQLQHILDVYDQDNATTWDMQPDGSYHRRQPAADEAPRPAQEVFIERALEGTCAPPGL